MRIWGLESHLLIPLLVPCSSQGWGEGRRKGERAGEMRSWLIKRSPQCCWALRIFFQGLFFFSPQGFISQNNSEWEWWGMNNNWLPGSLLTMVIISQPKSTGSRPIRDTSVLLFAIHLELFFFSTCKPIYSDFQARSPVIKKAFSLAPHPLWVFKTREEKVPNQLVREICIQAGAAFRGFGGKSLCNCICLWPSIFGGPLSHHIPALGSCFSDAAVANPQTAEREINHCHLSSVKNSASANPEEQWQTQRLSLSWMLMSLGEMLRLLTVSSFL